MSSHCGACTAISVELPALASSPACDDGNELQPNQRQRERSRSRDRGPWECEHIHPNRRDTSIRDDLNDRGATTRCTCKCERCSRQANCVDCVCNNETGRDWALRFPGMASKQDYDELMSFLDESVYGDDLSWPHQAPVDSQALVIPVSDPRSSDPYGDVEFIPVDPDDEEYRACSLENLSPSEMDTDEMTDESSDDCAD